VVIGAGFTGLSAALTLSDAVPRSVGTPKGCRRCHRNALLQQRIAHDFTALAAAQGIERARAIYHAFDAGVDALETIVREERIDCDFTRGGKLKLAAKPQHYESLARACEVLRREVDPDVEMVPASGIRDEVDSDEFFGGMIQKKSAQLHMGKFAAGLASAAVARGAKIFESAAVTRFERIGGDRYRLSTPRGTIEAAQVLVATGAFAQRSAGMVSLSHRAHRQLHRGH
jgi:glycine/D-amino acid oxidase-like deaminating enzyme